MVIPTDIRQFQLKHLLWIALSFCVPLSLWARLPILGIPLLVIVSFFWGGMGSLFISDTIDNSPINERGWVSQIFNLVGFFIVAFSIIGFAFFILFAVAIAFVQFLNV